MDTLKELEFDELYSWLWATFNHAGFQNTSSLLDDFSTLFLANLKCYQANMRILEIRKNPVGHAEGEEWVDAATEIAEAEWTARSVGEKRVAAKASINRIISESLPKQAPLADLKDITLEDDILYPIGEAIDRLAIEFIKQNHFRSLPDNTPGREAKIARSMSWSLRVKCFLDKKIRRVVERGWYEYNDEQRTYVLNAQV